MDNNKNFARLQQAKDEAFAQVDAQIHHWTSIKDNYQHLSDRLETLPDKPQYDITVPFGPLAFKRGQLVHSNELFVLLGDSWFAEVTCKQGQKLIDHRMGKVDENLQRFEKVKENLLKESDYITQMKGEEKTVEIKEEEPGPMPVRGKRVSRLKGNAREVVKAKDVKSEKEQPRFKSKMTDDEMLALLDTLEEQEMENNELSEENAVEESIVESRLTKTTSGARKEKTSKQVSFKLPVVDSDDSDDCDVTTSGATAANTSQIRFKHSDVVEDERDRVIEEKDGDSRIITPADIGRKTRSILKPSSLSSPTEAGTSDAADKPVIEKKWVTQEEVQERGFGDQSRQASHISTSTTEAIVEKPKRVSKFKSSRR